MSLINEDDEDKCVFHTCSFVTVGLLEIRNLFLFVSPLLQQQQFFDDDDRMVPSTPTLGASHRDGFDQAIQWVVTHLSCLSMNNDQSVIPTQTLRSPLKNKQDLRNIVSVHQFSTGGWSPSLQVWSLRRGAADQLLFTLWPGTARIARRLFHHQTMKYPISQFQNNTFWCQ